jgi:signal peptidase I
MIKLKKIHLSKLLEITYFCFLIFISALALVNLSSRVPHNKSFQIFSVVSGSMRPTIPVGGAIVVTKVPDYYVNDIISFRHANKIITHRVIYAGKYYLTKGDANNVIDNFQITKSQIIGKVSFSVPYVGYIQESSKTFWGLIGFIYFPALLIIIVESKLIIKEFDKFKAGGINFRPFAVVVIGIFVAVDSTYAFYSTKQLAFSGQISTIIATPSPTPVSTVIPTSESSPTPQPSVPPTSTGIPSPTVRPSSTANSANGTIIINQSNTSTQTTTVNNNVNSGNNSGQSINTSRSSATTTINNNSNTNSVIIH